MANATDVGISLEKGHPPGAAFGNDPTSKFAHVSKVSGNLPFEDFAAWCNRKETEWLAQITSVGRTPLLEGNEGKVAGPQAPAPVLDPDTAEINPTALRSAMQQLIEILPALPADATELRRARHARLVNDLERVGQLADLLPAMPSAQQGLALRDAYARASRSARQLAHNLDGSRWRRWKPEPSLATAYAGVAALLGALKDRHRSAAAVHLAKADAQREAQRLTEAGWRQGHAGDALVSGSGFNVMHMGAPLLGGGGKWQDWRFTDDDNKLYYVEQLCAFGEAGLGGAVGELEGKLAGKLASQFGTTVLMSLDQVALAKLVLNHHANRAAFTADGPRARAALARLEQLSALAQRALGKHYTGTPAVPCLGDARLAKGVNSAKLELIAETIDAAAGSNRFAYWLRQAYPSLPHLLRTRVDSGTPLPTDLVQSAVGASLVYRAKGLGQHQTVLSAEGTAGAGRAMDGELETGVSVAAGAGPLHFFFALPRAAHELLDPAHTRDLRQTLAMHAALEREMRTQPVMTAYHAVERLLTVPGSAKCAWPADGEDVYGAEGDVPASFHPAITAPCTTGLDAVTAACDMLAGQALDLVDCAELLRARPSRHWPGPMVQALVERRRQAFTTLAHGLFGGRPPCTLAQAMARPEDFIARCHDALSLALARVQTQRWLLVRGLERPDAKAADVAALARADAAHGKARSLLDAGHLGLTRRQLTKDASVQAHATYQRHEAALKVSLNVQPPAPSSSLEAAGLEAPLNFGVRTSAGRLAFSVEARWQVADYQINPARLGEFLQLTFKAEGGAPLLGDAVRDVVLQALRQRFPGADPATLQASTTGLCGQLQGLALDMAAGASVVVKLRRAPGVAGWDLQFVRGLSTRTSGIDMRVEAPTPGGLLRLGAQSGTTAQTCNVAIFGPDLGNLGMQMGTLERVLADLERLDDSVQACFDAHPEAKTMYFGLPNTVPTVLQRFLDREDDTQRETHGAPEPLPSEFYRFYDQAPFARVARTGPELLRHQPGQGLGAPPAPQPVSVRALFEDRGVDWPAAKRHLATLRTAEDRLHYYAGEGRAVFDAFVAVMRELDGHNAAFIANGAPGRHGFVMSVNGAR